MAEPTTAKTGASVAAFIRKVPDTDLRKDCETVVDLMRKATRAEPEMWGSGIVGFGSHVYGYKNGRALEWFKLGFAPRAHGLSLYLQTGFTGYDALLSRIGKFKTGKSCVMVKRLADVDLSALRDLLAKSASQPGK